MRTEEETRVVIRQGDWLTLSAEPVRLFRVTKEKEIAAGSTTVTAVPVLEIMTPGDIKRVLKNKDTSIRSDLRIDPESLEMIAYMYGGEEDRNGNGKLDHEDLNYNGIHDQEDRNGNGKLDHEEDLNGNGKLDHEKDLNGNGIFDQEDRNQEWQA